MMNKVIVNVDMGDINIECGQVFLNDGEAHILCLINCLYSLVSLSDGNRWCDPLLSLHEIEKIIINDGFVPLGNVKITVEKLS